MATSAVALAVVSTPSITQTGSPGGKRGRAAVTSPTASIALEIQEAAVPVRSTSGDHSALKVHGIARRLMRPSSVSEAP